MEFKSKLEEIMEAEELNFPPTPAFTNFAKFGIFCKTYDFTSFGKSAISRKILF